MLDERGEKLRAVSMRELRKTLRRAGVRREFVRGLRRRIPRGALAVFGLGLGMVVLSVGSVVTFSLLRRVFGFELEPVYKVHSFRWWAEELVVVGVVGGVPLLVVGTVVLWFERRRVSLRAAAAVELGFCGGCGYGLSELVAEEDGCVVCPECGAAWRAGEGAEGA